MGRSERNRIGLFLVFAMNESVGLNIRTRLFPLTSPENEKLLQRLEDEPVSLFQDHKPKEFDCTGFMETECVRVCV